MQAHHHHRHLWRHFLKSAVWAFLVTFLISLGYFLERVHQESQLISSSASSIATSWHPLLDGTVTTSNVCANYHRNNTHQHRSTYIARIQSHLETSLLQLKVDPSVHPNFAIKLQDMAELIYESMNGPLRYYHSVPHIGDVIYNLANDNNSTTTTVLLDPIAVLAALFHDVVYYHVDGGLTLQQYQLVHDAIDIVKAVEGPMGHSVSSFDAQEHTILVRDEFVHKKTAPCPNATNIVCMVEDIFGYTTLPSGKALNVSHGLNEFLSALIAVRSLQEFLPMTTLAEIAACIEATIPFRGADDQGYSPMDRLYQRMVGLLNTHRQWNLSDQHLTHAVQRAAMVANADVANFASHDMNVFLDCTWSLLPESTPNLRAGADTRIHHLHEAFFKMHHFLRKVISPDKVFHQYHSVPHDLEDRQRQAAHNLRIAQSFLAARTVEVSLFVALAELSGEQNAPASLFATTNDDWKELLDDDKLDKDTSGAEYNPEVYALLLSGRRSAMPFDGRQSPIVAFLYRVLGDDGMEQLLSHIFAHPPMNQKVAQDFLRALPRDVLHAIGPRIARVVESRSHAIFQLATSFTIPS